VCLAPQQLRSLAPSDITLTDGPRATLAVELGPSKSPLQDRQNAEGVNTDVSNGSCGLFHYIKVTRLRT
jgi:hypothetical protein